MLTIRKILFPTDFSESAEHAFSHAAHLASYFDAEVHVFHTKVRVAESYPALQHLLEEADEEEAAGIALPHAADEHRMKAPKGDQVIVIQAEHTSPSACDSIQEYARDHDIDLIVMGTHGRRGPKRLFIGSTAECVVRHTDRPVLTLRSDADVMQQDELKHLIVPVDFSSFTEEAVRYAREFAKVWKSRITLLHVIEEAVLPTVYGIEPVSVFTADHVLEQSKKALADMKAKFFKETDQVETHVAIGHAATSIADFAEEVGGDLIIIPTHGLTGLKRFLMGSVTELVVRTAPCAVLTMKPFGHTLLRGASTTTANMAS